MLKIRIKKTGQVRSVERNEAHELINKGEAELVTPANTPAQSPSSYNTRKMTPTQTKTK